MKSMKSNGLSQKEKDALDRQMEQLQPKMIEAKHKYDALVSQYAELQEKRYPEKTEAHIKETLYQAYQNSNRSLDQILAYMAGEEETGFSVKLVQS